MNRRFGIAITAEQVAACVGTKEFVASVAGFLHLQDETRDTVLFPAISYPTYAMGATLAGLRSVSVAMVDGKMDLDSIDPSDIKRALLLWSNSPSNPTGKLDDLGAHAAWGRTHGVLVASDECYADFTWADRPRTILEHGTEGVLAVHSISKRSNLAGVRAGFYAGDEGVVKYLRSLRQHAGLMVPAPVQDAVAVAYGDEVHVEEQRAIYRERLQVVSDALMAHGFTAPMPEGSFYLWCAKDGLDGWQLAREVAERTGMIISPGDLYGDAGKTFARIAVVQSTERLREAVARL
jgi:aspartate/methionine/tyrosine aminotransferase